MKSLRIGILGAARIAPMALVRPARKVPEVVVAAVAARDPARARAFADKHCIPRVHESYAELVADPEIDAIYNPLPNGLHCEWNLAALEAGKHLLCEKPFTSNAGQAETVAKAAVAADRVVMEAFHYRYHPLADRMIEVVRSGELGKIRHIETNVCIPLPVPGDIRYRLDLAGGASMDTGCYAIHMLRSLAGDEPEVRSASTRLSSPGVDRWMRADMGFADGRTGRITCSLFSSSLLNIQAKVVGEAGELRVLNPLAPHLHHRLTIRGPNGKRSEKLAGDSTYHCQLRAFANAVLQDGPVLTPPSDSIANMRVIDAVYEHAGLQPRP